MTVSASPGKNRLNFKGCFQYFKEKKGADFFGVSSDIWSQTLTVFDLKISEKPGSLD